MIMRADVIKKHDCSSNYAFYLSVKSMEPAIAVKICEVLLNYGVWVTTAIGNDDTSTIARIRESNLLPTKFKLWKKSLI